MNYEKFQVVYLIKKEHEGIINEIEVSLEQILGGSSKPSPKCIPLIRYEIKRKIDEITITFYYSPLIDRNYIPEIIPKEIEKRHRRDIKRVGRQ